MDLQKYLKERQSLIEEALCATIFDGHTPQRLADSMAYSLKAGGKRLRPILVIAGAEAVGGSAFQVLSAAVAMEMIHTFSLIHDDLPAMDDDNLRRGKPTNHIVYGEANAILAGDGLLAEAFAVLSDASKFPQVKSERLVEVIRDIALATGPRGMTGGQVIDMESTGNSLKESDLERLHDHKTGKLITVSVVSGAKLSDATETQLKALKRYGDTIGRAFQIADDILDIEGNQEDIGKNVGSDECQGKSTYPTVIGMEASKKKARELVEQAIEALSIFGDEADPLRAIAGYVVERKK